MRKFLRYALYLGLLCGSKAGFSSDSVKDLTEPLSAIRNSPKVEGIEVPENDDHFLRLYFTGKTVKSNFESFYNFGKEEIQKNKETKNVQNLKNAFGWFTLAACYGGGRSMNILKSIYKKGAFGSYKLGLNELNTLKAHECVALLFDKRDKTGEHLYDMGMQFEEYERNQGKKDLKKAQLMYKWAGGHFFYPEALKKLEELGPEKAKLKTPRTPPVSMLVDANVVDPDKKPRNTNNSKLRQRKKMTKLKDEASIPLISNNSPASVDYY